MNMRWMIIVMLICASAFYRIGDIKYDKVACWFGKCIALAWSLALVRLWTFFLFWRSSWFLRCAYSNKLFAQAVIAWNYFKNQ